MNNNLTENQILIRLAYWQIFIAVCEFIQGFFI